MHGPAGSVDVARGGEPQDLLVLRGLALPGGNGGPGDRGDQSGLVADLVEHPAEQRVAAGQVERAVEVAVGQGPFGRVLGAGRPAQRLVRRVERGPGADGAAHRLGFEEQPHVVDGAGHVRVDHPDRDALVLAHHHETAAREGLERLADGVFDTPNRAASSVSTSACPGLSPPVRMSCLIASRTYWVLEGMGLGAKAMAHSQISCIASHI